MDWAALLKRILGHPLVSSRWVATRQNIVLTGATSSGNSWLAGALGNKACRDGYSVLYYIQACDPLLDELNAARAEGNYARMLHRLVKVGVLILDDFCMTPLGSAGLADLFEVLEDRYNATAIVIGSQLDPDKWHVSIGTATSADSICDRLVHFIHRLRLQGESIRNVIADEQSKANAQLYRATD